MVAGDSAVEAAGAEAPVTRAESMVIGLASVRTAAAAEGKRCRCACVVVYFFILQWLQRSWVFSSVQHYRHSVQHYRQLTDCGCFSAALPV